jgi:penicillin amidase
MLEGSLHGALRGTVPAGAAAAVAHGVKRLDPARTLFRLSLGRRLPATNGTITVPGTDGAVLIRRDAFGIPHIRATTDADGCYGLGFCHGQDRSFQLESLLRLARGTLSEIVGKAGLPMDRLSRRIGFTRGVDEQLAVLRPDIRGALEAYARGVTAGGTAGLPAKAHEFALLLCRPTPWSGADVMAMARLQSFFFAFNADTELARLKILTEDGPEVLAALDPAYPDWMPVSSPPGSLAGQAVDRLAEDLGAFSDALGRGGASNGWALAPSRTSTGRPILANDPHLPPLLPSPWYLAQVATPEWTVAGASYVGAPIFPVGHNGFCAWGVTAALVDTTDLFVERMGPDGRSVARDGTGSAAGGTPRDAAEGRGGGTTYVACTVRREEIRVRGGSTAVEEVVETPRGPIVGPALEGEVGAISFKVFWLDPAPVEGLLGVHRAGSFEEFRQLFARWPSPAFNVMYADRSGRIGWQLTGAVPQRRKGWGTIPLPGWDPGVGWEDEPVPFDQMPHVADPDGGFVVTANNPPHTGGKEPFLGVDFMDGYRIGRIVQMIGERPRWDVPSVQRMQTDQLSLPWGEMRETVLAAAGNDPDRDPDARAAAELLSAWDGRVGAGEPAGAVFELFVAELSRRVARARAKRSARYVLGQGFALLLPETTFSFRRVGHLVRLLREQPEGWFERPWSEEIAHALSAAVRTLRSSFGDDPPAWAWGTVRPLTLRHPVGDRKPLDRVFNRGPFPYGGDANTVAQAAVNPLDPLANPGYVPSLRAVFDVGAWEESRFVLPAGQSGNPLSPHYDDQLPLWQSGRRISIAFTEDEVELAATCVLHLLPG